MRSFGSHLGLRCIALSGYGTKTDIARSREAGFSEHLVKRVNFVTRAAGRRTGGQVAVMAQFERATGLSARS